ncbi:protein phosphatase CheZ [Starkeya koreensis]|uniref:Protein phosphatase CheZ n=1 Tax=Ancylobacter koreensis TaxID=266121 RepID=A0ABT0DKR4_9HYPH|nr:protein phosphatase CheZ [Ancylobacter koreensis]MCK0207893.1 protein phosphatase CheZ [Ancylobacter koreensis]
MRRPFRIEVSDRHAASIPSTAQEAVSAQIHRVLDELHELRGVIARFDRRCPELDPECSRHAMLLDVESIREAIENTKCELASLKTGGARGARFDRATDELQAVVADTEAATEDILQMAENIDGAALPLVAELEGSQKAAAQAIHAYATRIFEACNFQDISGQRIRKVVDLMVFIEERVERMSSIWGGQEEVARIASSLGGERTGDEALLNGPALADDENVVSQDDIDSLFA